MCNDALIETAGSSGMAVAYKAQMTTQRLVWISPGFIEHEGKFCRILVPILGRPGCKWKTVAPEHLGHFKRAPLP